MSDDRNYGGDAQSGQLLSDLFSRSEPQLEPVLVLLAGHHGAAPGRAIRRVQEQHPERIAPIAADIVSALQHVNHRADAGQRPLHSVAEDLQNALAYAREHRLSVLLEGPFLSPSTALGVASRFKDAGFRVRVVAVGARSDQSLLAATSLYLHQMQVGGMGKFVTVESHASSVAALSELVEVAERNSGVHRISILDRRGAWAFDTDQGDAGALRALRTVESARMSSLESAQWLSELRRITEYSRSLRTVPAPIAESLIALHGMALRNVVPELPVPDESEVARIQQQRHAAEIAALRAVLALREQQADLAAPSPGAEAPSRDGLNL